MKDILTFIPLWIMLLLCYYLDEPTYEPDKGFRIAPLSTKGVIEINYDPIVPGFTEKKIRTKKSNR